MTLLEAISPTARKLLAITKGERRKVHAPTEDHKPLCGGGGLPGRSRPQHACVGVLG